MRLSRQFQTCLFKKKKKISRAQKAPNVKQTISTPSEVFLHITNVASVSFIRLFLFVSWFLLVSVFLRSNFFLKKISRFEIVSIASFHTTTNVYPPQPTYWVLYLHARIFNRNQLRKSLLFMIIFLNRFCQWESLLFMRTFLSLSFLWKFLLFMRISLNPFL